MRAWPGPSRQRRKSATRSPLISSIPKCCLPRGGNWPAPVSVEAVVFKCFLGGLWLGAMVSSIGRTSSN
jgi:hypothetical protein